MTRRAAELAPAAAVGAARRLVQLVTRPARWEAELVALSSRARAQRAVSLTRRTAGEGRRQGVDVWTSSGGSSVDRSAALASASSVRTSSRNAVEK